MKDGRESRGCREGDGEVEGEEAPSLVVGADGVGGHESELSKEVVVVAVASSAADERLPVGVQGLDAARRRPVLAERDDLAPVGAQRVVQAAHRDVGPALGAKQDVGEPAGQRVTGRSWNPVALSTTS